MLWVVLNSLGTMEVHVHDEEGKPLGYSAVSVYREDKFIGGGYTDEEGRIIFKDMEYGRYTIVAEHVGYLPETVHVKLEEEFLRIRIGLELSDVMLDEQTVVAKKPRVIYEHDRIIVRSSPTNETGNALDMLREVPGVVVIGDNVQIRGTSRFKVYVDGKPHPLGRRILKNLPANSIERIEIITTPSAKYEAQTHVVLNIILKKNRKGEFSLNAKLGTYDNFGIGLFAGYGNSSINLQHENFAQYRYVDILLNDRTFGGRILESYPWTSGSFMVQWKDLEFGLNLGIWKNIGAFRYDVQNGSSRFQGNYLSLYTRYKGIGIYYSPMVSTLSSYFGELSSGTNDTLHLLRLNMDFKFKGIEYGYLGDMRIMKNHFFSNDTNHSDMYNRFMNGIYLSYGGKKERFGWNLGIRYEHVVLERYSRKTYNDLYPSVMLSYRIDENSSVFLNATRRVSFPPIWLSTTYELNIAPNIRIVRNIPVEPYYTYRVELGYKNPYVYSSLSYSRSLNEWLVDFPEFKGDTVLLTTRIMDLSEGYNFLISWNYKFLSISPSIYYERYVYGNETSELIFFTVNASLMYKDFSISAIYFGDRELFHTSMEIEPPIFLYISYSRTFFKKLKVNLSLRNTLNSYVTIRRNLGANSFSTTLREFYPRIDLSITYNYDTYKKLSRKKGYDIRDELRN